MKQRATIVQHSFNKYETIIRCETKETEELVEAWKEYEIKFHGEEATASVQFIEFHMWVAKEGGEYIWNSDLNTNEGNCPYKFHCWCEALEYYLELKGYKKTMMTNKLFAFEKDINCDIIKS